MKEMKEISLYSHERYFNQDMIIFQLQHKIIKEMLIPSMRFELLSHFQILLDIVSHSYDSETFDVTT